MEVVSLFEIGPESKVPGGFSLKLMAQLTVLGRDLRSLSQHHLHSGSVKSIMTSGNWPQPFFSLFLQMLSRDLMFSIATSFSCF